MALNRAKEDILKKIRQALIRKAPTQSEPNFVSDIYAKPDEEDLLVMFAQNLVKTKAAFFIAKTKKILLNNCKLFHTVKVLNTCTYGNQPCKTC